MIGFNPKCQDSARPPATNGHQFSLLRKSRQPLSTLWYGSDRITKGTLLVFPQISFCKSNSVFRDEPARIEKTHVVDTTLIAVVGCDSRLLAFPAGQVRRQPVGVRIRFEKSKEITEHRANLVTPKLLTR